MKIGLPMNNRIRIQRSILVSPPYNTTYIILNEILKIKNIKNALDMGTGTGIIAIELAKRSFDVTATDISNKAVRLAMLNIKENNVKVNIFQSDLFDKVSGKFDLIVFNSPVVFKRKPVINTIGNIILNFNLIDLVHRFSNLEKEWKVRMIKVNEFIYEAKNYLSDIGIIVTMLTQNEIDLITKDKNIELLHKIKFDQIKAYNIYITKLKFRNVK
jgi:methylase of polypeptide subunit release factors